MRIARWNGPANYGDDLNYFLWPKLLHPNFTSILPDGMFYGIGSMLGSRMPPSSHHVVFGAGAGYQGKPIFREPVKIYFVRGPLTANAIGDIPHITDPGIMMARLFDSRDYMAGREPSYDCSFMPRWNSMGSVLEDGCRASGIHLIDPRRPIPDVTAEIRGSRLLLTEALHGAVVADTLRTPWISIRAQDGHDFKWYDWCASMNMTWNPIDAQHQGLSWARDLAVPQLSALSIHDARLSDMLAALDALNRDIEANEVFP